MIKLDLYEVFWFLWIAVHTNDLGEFTTAKGLTSWGATNRLIRKLDKDDERFDEGPGFYQTDHYDPYWERR